MIIEFTLNGNPQKVSVSSAERAVDVLASQCGIGSVSANCLQGACGSCMILLDGNPAYSCMLPAFSLRDRTVDTLERFQKTKEFAVLSSEMQKEGIDMCCAGESAPMLLALHLAEHSISPSEADIRDALSNAHCDCIAPEQFVHAVQSAVHRLDTARKAP